MKDRTAKNEHSNADVTRTAMKDVVDEELHVHVYVQHVHVTYMYANGKDETDLSCVSTVHLAGTSRSDVGINTMVDTVTTPIAAIAIDIVQMKGKISHFYTCNMNHVIRKWSLCYIVHEPAPKITSVGTTWGGKFSVCFFESSISVDEKKL